MKKLMFAAAVAAAMTMGAQAAAFVWFADGAYGEDWAGQYIGTTAEVHAYLYLGSVNGYDSGFDFGGAKELDWCKQDEDTFNFGSSGKKSSEKLVSDAAGQAYSIILVEASGGKLDSYKGHYAILSGSSTQEGIPFDTWAVFNSSRTLGQSDWKTMSTVPEPTSALLMLLGLAGLALKRKVA